jgi:hypothetical protein
MRRVAVMGTFLGLLHFALTLVHGLPHNVLHIEVSPRQLLFIVGVIQIGPCLAMILLWTRFHYAGRWLFTLSMAGAFVFGGYYHFIVPSPDHVAYVPAGAWGDLFRATAVLLALVEGVSAAVGFRWLQAKADLPRVAQPVELH